MPAISETLGRTASVAKNNDSLVLVKLAFSSFDPESDERSIPLNRASRHKLLCERSDL